MLNTVPPPADSAFWVEPTDSDCITSAIEV